MNDIERISTGIEELDKILKGGIPKGFVVAVTGEPGTGKTILCLHFIARGLRDGEPGIYVTTEESRESIIRQAEQFGWDFLEAMAQGKLIIIDALLREQRDEWSLSRLTIDELIGMIIKAKKTLGYGHARLVIDSMSAFWLDKPAMARKYAYQVKRSLYKWNLTILMTSQYAITTSDAFGFGIEHVADGIIRFRRFVRNGELRRFLIVEKMRQTEHDLRMWEIKIINGIGLKLVKPVEFRREDFALPRRVIERILRASEEKEKEF
ncbi:MAG: KaiC domain-containing protein [Candidatus Njordarchaeales archaeon]